MHTSEQIARAFHETYERLAPDHGYSTREASAKPWDEVPEQNKGLMLAVVSDLLARGVIEPGAFAGIEDFELPQGHTVEVYKDESDNYRWRRKAANHEIVADSGEGYTDQAYARFQARTMNPGVEVVDLTVDGQAEPTADVPIWHPGAVGLGPHACPHCGSVGTATDMSDHIASEHPEIEQTNPLPEKSDA